MLFLCFFFFILSYQFHGSVYDFIMKYHFKLSLFYPVLSQRGR